MKNILTTALMIGFGTGAMGLAPAPPQRTEPAEKTVLYYSPGSVSTILTAPTYTSTRPRNKNIMDEPAEFFSEIARSPIDGYTITLAGAEALTTPQQAKEGYDALRRKLKSLASDRNVWVGGDSDQSKLHLRKKLVPLVYLSRLVGKCEGAPQRVVKDLESVDLPNPTPRAAAVDCYAIDVSDPNKIAFFAEFRQALAFAKWSGSPGIMIDHEPYVNYNAYTLGQLITHVRAKKRLNQEDAKKYILGRFNSMAATLSKSVNNLYPDAQIWLASFKVDGFQPQIRNGKIVSMDFTDKASLPSIFFYHFLKQASLHQYTFKIIEGAENSVWYPKYSAEYSANKLDAQSRTYQPYSTTYAANFSLGAPISFWDDFWNNYSANDLFMKKAPPTKQVTATKLSDLKPIFKHLYETRDYIWIWPKRAGLYHFDEFSMGKTDPRTQEFTSAVRELIQEVRTDVDMGRAKKVMQFPRPSLFINEQLDTQESLGGT